VQPALTEVEEILSYLETGHLQGTLEPLRVTLTCYRVLDAAGDPRQTKILTEAYRHLQERATAIDDEELRRSYLENVAVNRELLAAWEAIQ
jgi:hypothetical protein